MLSELDVLRDVGARLESAGIPYMLTGSMAMNYYATPRMTRDIDLVVALSVTDSARIRSLFEPAYYVPDNLEQAIASIGVFNLVHIESVIKVDIIVRKSEDYRRAEFERRLAVDLEGARIARKTSSCPSCYGPNSRPRRGTPRRAKSARHRRRSGLSWPLGGTPGCCAHAGGITA